MLTLRKLVLLLQALQVIRWQNWRCLGQECDEDKGKDDDGSDDDDDLDNADVAKMMVTMVIGLLIPQNWRRVKALMLTKAATARMFTAREADNGRDDCHFEHSAPELPKPYMQNPSRLDSSSDCKSRRREGQRFLSVVMEMLVVMVTLLLLLF